MKNAVFWDIKMKFVLHRRRITSTLQSTAIGLNTLIEVLSKTCKQCYYISAMSYKEMLRYKLEGRGFCFRRRSLAVSFDPVLPDNLTRPLTEMSNRNLPRGEMWSANKDENLIAIWNRLSRKRRVSTSHNSIGLQSLFTRSALLFTFHMAVG
jgi:hypothetical protein